MNIFQVAEILCAQENALAKNITLGDKSCVALLHDDRSWSVDTFCYNVTLTTCGLMLQATYTDSERGLAATMKNMRNASIFFENAKESNNEQV